MRAVGTSPNEGVPLLVVISGPSGVGKDAILYRMKSSGVPYHFAVTATARPKRDNEVDGVDYHFVSRDEFQNMIQNHELLEWAEVYGNLYGVPKSPVRDALARGQDVILKIDVQGGDNIRRLVPRALYVFLAPPDMTELERRLTQRRTESPEALRLRMETAAKEMEEAEKYDHVVVNRTGRLDEVVDEVNSIIRRERARPGREPIVI